VDGRRVTWTPDPEAFVRDLEQKPAALRALAPFLEADGTIDFDGTDRVVFVGMGSSQFAALPVASTIRATGRQAVVERVRGRRDTRRPPDARGRDLGERLDARNRRGARTPPRRGLRDRRDHEREGIGARRGRRPTHRVACRR